MVHLLVLTKPTAAMLIECSGASCHVKSWGNEQKDMFKNEREGECFLSYLKSAEVHYDVLFMPNA